MRILSISVLSIPDPKPRAQSLLKLPALGLELLHWSNGYIVTLLRHDRIIKLHPSMISD